MPGIPVRPTNPFLEFKKEDPDQPVSFPPILTDAECQKLVVEWNDTQVDYPASCIHELFEAQAEKTPDAVAVVFEEGQLTYRKLNERANQLAHYLQKHGVGPEVLVGICVERSLEMVVGLLGILKAGGAYVPLDPNYPKERLAFMLEDSKATILLTQEKLKEELPKSEVTVVFLDSDGEKISRESAENPYTEMSLESLAYLNYTSGSTGYPKGVQIPHEALTNFLDSMIREPGLNEKDILLAVTTLSFDIAALEVFGPLIVGGQVILASREAASDGHRLSKMIHTSSVTVMQATPATWRILVEIDQAPCGLKILCGGEALQRNLANAILGKGNSLWNMYGPTETTIWSTRCKIDSGDGPIFIGRPIANTQIYILNENLEPIPVGVPGELHIGGAGMARGYLNRPELTAEKFIPNPFTDAPGARLYKTGDLARYLPDGNIEFLGRIDHQVKIRGFRIELGEIETVLSKHPAVDQCVVLAREDAPGDKRLVAYMVAGDEKNTAVNELRSFLKDKLPEYMIPTAFVMLDSFPLTPNGKLDRQALPIPTRHHFGDRENFEHPSTQVEETLAKIWADLLGFDRVSRQDHFIECGGHSLLATQLLSRIREVFRIELRFETIFENPTLESMAHVIGKRKSENPDPISAPISPVPRDIPLPLSFSQERVWFMHQLEPENLAYNFQALLRLKGQLNVEVLRKCLSEMVQRHEIYRTTFSTVRAKPVQLIHDAREVELPIRDVSDIPKEWREKEAQRLFSTEFQISFDLAKLPLVRWTLIRLSPQEHLLVHVEHHLVHDGWSFNLFLRELMELYNSYSAGDSPHLPDMPIQFADFAQWEREWEKGEEAKTQLAYWKKKLAGMPSMLQLATDRPRPTKQRFVGSLIREVLPPRLYDSLQEFSRREGVTLFMTMFAAFALLMSRYARQDDIGIGAGVANRRQRESEGLIGMLVNNIVLRTDLSGNPTIRELLHRVRQLTLEGLAHQDIPFNKVVEALQPARDLSRNPLFQVMFGFHDSWLPPLHFSELETTLSEIMRNGSAKFDMNVIIIPRSEQRIGSSSDVDDNDLIVTWEYNTDLFDESSVAQMIKCYQNLLENFVIDPDRRISHLSLLSHADQHQLLSEWNNTQVDSPRDSCIHELFEAQAEKTPDTVAVVFEEGHLTYRELNERVNQLAHHLRGLGVGPDVLVAICVERSLEMVVGLLGILKAGGAYVPLDPTYPKERLAFMLKDAGASVLLTQAPLLEKLPAHEAHVVCLDQDREAIARESQETPASGVTADNLAYVIYTSGSTGRPKGVLITHESIVGHCLTMEKQYDLVPSDRILQFASLNFDTSIEQIFSTLLSGARLILPGTNLVDSTEFSQMVVDSGLTVVNLPPAYWHQLAQEWFKAPEQISGHHFRLFIVGGDVMLAESLRLWRESPVRTARLFNAYGPTEATVTSTLYEISPEEDDLPHRIPIGRPLPGRSMYILDANLEPVPIGVPGELHIGGANVGRGYLNRPELTAEKFILDPFSDAAGARLYKTGDLCRYLPDGNIDFLGRIDDQVKIRGFRIELGEIEAVLQEHPDLRECVVLAREDEPGEKRLVAYVAAGNQQVLSVEALRGLLKNKLPEYMIPSAFVMLDSLPLTPNGKLDRRALPAPDQSRPEFEKVFIAPRTEVEKGLAKIWARILKVDQVGIHDNFFELGGHSLMVTRVMAQVSAQMGLDIPLITIFESPTIAEMAKTILNQTTAQIDSKEMERLLDEVESSSEND